MTTGWLVAGALAWASIGSQAEDLPEVVSRAERELRQQLQEAYPDVTAWEITPMLRDRGMAGLATGAAVRIDAVKLGRRSALQMSWQEGRERRRCAVWFDVRGQRPAWRVSADVKRNESIVTAALHPDESAEWEPGCSAV
ncbi:MAG TPA: hypothetical protein VNR40_21360, partial [Steroidobacter sp.]|nr:hypothetical protein [Steroidobacter sp.]